MSEPTKKTIKKLFALSGNICAFPGCSIPIVENAGTVIGEICHIQAKNKGGPRYNSSLSIKKCNAFENLILLCRNHHKVIDAQPELYTPETLSELKNTHESAVGRSEKSEDNFFSQILLNGYKHVKITNNSGNISINSPHSIQGEKVTINTRRKNIKIAPPPNSLGAHPDLSKYIAHLISRYNEFASKGSNRKRKFNYGAVSKNMKDKFGASWQLLGEDYAKKVICYLQDRIDRTMLARINKGKGYAAYSTLQEYIKKYSAKDI